MKRIYGLMTLIVAALLIIIIVARPQSGDGVVRIGVMAPMTGSLAIYGENMQRGFQMAREDLIAEGVIDDLKIIYEDACDTKTSNNAARKLVERNKVEFIAGSFCLFGLDSVADYLEERETIVFNTAANPESVLNRPYVFSTNVAIREDAKAMATYAYETLGVRRVSRIHLDSSFGESYRDNFTDAFESRGGQVLSTHGKLPTAHDFRTEITEIKNDDAGMILIVHFGGALGSAIKQVRELGFEGYLMGTYESEDPAVIENAGPAGEEYLFSSSTAAVTSDRMIEFEQRYRDMYGEDPEVLARNAYDSLYLGITKMMACDRDTDCVREDLESVRDYDGVGGKITVDPDDHSVAKPSVFKQITGGEFVIVK